MATATGQTCLQSLAAFSIAPKFQALRRGLEDLRVIHWMALIPLSQFTRPGYRLSIGAPWIQANLWCSWNIGKIQQKWSWSKWQRRQFVGGITSLRVVYLCTLFICVPRAPGWARLTHVICGILDIINVGLVTQPIWPSTQPCFGTIVLNMIKLYCNKAYLVPNFNWCLVDPDGVDHQPSEECPITTQPLYGTPIAGPCPPQRLRNQGIISPHN